MEPPEHIQRAIHEYIPHMEGWTSPERGCEMAAAIIEIKARVCVDIGVFAGRSTIAMGFAARDLGNCMVYGIDPWSPAAAYAGDDVEVSAQWWKEKSNLEAIHQQAMKAVWDHNIEPWLVIIRARSEYVHQLFSKIDVLNIDGAHGEKSSCQDVINYMPKLRAGGYLFFDDADWGSTQKALTLIEKECELVNTVKAANESRTYRKK